MSVSMPWGVSALARMRGALRVPHVGARRLHITPVTESKNRGRARKSPKTLLRLYAEGKLKGSEAVKAAALLEAQNAEQAGTVKETVAEEEVSDTLSLSDARHVIRVCILRRLCALRVKKKELTRNFYFSQWKLHGHAMRMSFML